jgi:hypothetical protein
MPLHKFPMPVSIQMVKLAHSLTLAVSRANSNQWQFRQMVKIVIAGWYRFDDGSRAFAAMRLNADGSTDNSFGTLGVKIINFENDSYASVVAIQPDGKIILAGSSGFIEHNEHTDDPKYDIVVVRLLANSAPRSYFRH